jgi:hypothetical protein
MAIDRQASDGVHPMLERRILESFDRFRDLPAGPSLKSLRQRLVGELFGDSADVAATFDPAFEVLSHGGERSVRIPGSAIAEAARDRAAAGMLMWLELDDLVIDGDSIAACGAMVTLHVTQRTLTTVPIGIFFRFSGGRMTSEVFFMGRPPETIDVSAEEMPSADALRAHLNSQSAR